MADYDWFDRTPHPAEIEAARWRPKGLFAKFSHDSLGKINGIEYYTCARGCGTIVWYPKDHIKNVCTTFNPVVGD